MAPVRAAAGAVLVCVVLAALAAPSAAGFRDETEQCFCRLNGMVEDCCCDVETVNEMNNNLVYPHVRALVNTTFFRFYKVNLHRGCPFWHDDGRCMNKDCTVYACDEAAPAASSSACAASNPNSLDAVNATLSQGDRENIKSWTAHDDLANPFCDVGDENSADAEYANLLLNPERFTGYDGVGARRVWDSIYGENCFVAPGEGTSAASPFAAVASGGECLEKRVFHRLLSGLHASISVHICRNYLDRWTGKWGPNAREFTRRFSPATTGGEGPTRLKNIYFAYLLVLRAVTKGADMWADHDFYTGDEASDEEARRLVHALSFRGKECPSTFDERIMFAGPDADALRAQFRDKFRNISRIMDCVGCDKCRLWGKLQVHGLAVALHILFSAQGSEPPRVALARNDIVALFNVLGRLSSSVRAIHEFRNVEDSPFDEHDGKAPVPFWSGGGLPSRFP